MVHEGNWKNNQRRRPNFGFIFIIWISVIFQLLDNAIATSSPPSIPRSTNTRSIYSETGDESDSDADSSESKRKPPWNLSSKIDSAGFFTSKYKRIHGDWEHGIPNDEYDKEEGNIDEIHEEETIGDDESLLPIIGGRYHCLDEPVVIRQVPGDGNCLFHSISISMSLVTNRTHVDMTKSSRVPRKTMKIRRGVDGASQSHSKLNSHTDTYKHDLKHLYHHSRHLRSAAVGMLSRNPRKLLFLQGNEYLRAKDLVSAAAAQYGMTGKEYCTQMKKDSYWGGGPEIVALCNYLKRPIHVYELSSAVDEYGNKIKDVFEDNVDSKTQGTEIGKLPTSSWSVPPTSDSQFRLRRMACFGSPKFDRKEALHILSADSRFPDIESGKQLPSGNHFLALFPEGLIASIMEEETSKRKIHKKLKRGRHERAEFRGGDARIKENYFGFRNSGDDTYLSNGILKYCRIDFIWNLFRRLKLAFI